MKKIRIYAYTHGNLGDDLFIKIICERYPDTTFVLYAPRHYRTTFQNLPNLVITPSDSLMYRIANLLVRKFNLYFLLYRWLDRDCKASVQIGGSLFIQGDQWRKELQITKAMRRKKRPFFLLGANFGPYDDPDFYTEHKRIFQDDQDICFREEHSYKLFQDLKPVRLAADIVFQLPVKKALNHKKVISISVIKPSVRKHLADMDRIYYTKIKDIALLFIERGYEVLLLSFCEYEEDPIAIKEIVSRIPETARKKVKTSYYKNNPEEILQQLADSAGIIATRFHAMIIGWIYQKPVYPILYSSKTLHVMEDIGFTGHYTDFAQLHKLHPLDVQQSMEMAAPEISKEKVDSENHFKELDVFLGRKRNQDDHLQTRSSSDK
ncbi:colanic acid biosynthesis protein [Oceanobacillus picturae]|uniref:Colanic acid biosynthesis protein n=1 Tax=Oceanobacillus picturae TaxID=171693 RepID=A0A0U9H3H7_9BACI|nr:polysaccharide pyruvyl transferase family protein [Oceanobacillus picturae]GAQ16891.1 colanic acid biosynthesis protein [Oceanobacillus picturae]